SRSSFSKSHIFLSRSRAPDPLRRPTTSPPHPLRRRPYYAAALARGTRPLPIHAPAAFLSPSSPSSPSDPPRSRRRWSRSDPSAQSLSRAPGRRPCLRVPVLANGRPDRARQPDCFVAPSSRYALSCPI
uniref:Uncharacterized protein n=1 Tax=Triticum urartu TaxID=4572 RepID=A0A8R7V5Z0_TRIUA